ncbi:flavin reductase [Pedobacter lusitanus]|uniref:Flavin reductase n=1 Tax=Pedobacter lusitanus TaxID=1503925 RepID=A0A0D0F2R2_9SPHI|nr:flavin reductase family protein [Pedobacter lusitanus]KIO75833.1 flavin reductase [Pedobacter lusitanus]
MHSVSEPEILYFGTPVVLISTCNEDDSYNLAPISSVFWLGWRCVIGIAGSSQTTKNMIRTGQCVLNLPSVNEVAAVNLLARTTGANPVPESKIKKGYHYEADKFKLAGLTAISSDTVLPPGVKECPVRMEAIVEAVHSLCEDDPLRKGNIYTIELRIQCVHLDDGIIMDGKPNRVDPDKWKPLIMSFQQFYSLGERVHESTLSDIDEAEYHSADLDRAMNLNSLS